MAAAALPPSVRRRDDGARHRGQPSLAEAVELGRACARPAPLRRMPACALSTARTAIGRIGAVRARPALGAARRRCGPRAAGRARAGQRPGGRTTSPSSRLLDASRLAPCTPVAATSPTAIQAGHIGRAPSDRCGPRRTGSARPARPGSVRSSRRCPPRRTRRERSGSARAGSAPRCAVASSQTLRRAVAAHDRVDLAGDDVARGQVGHRMPAGHDRPPGRVDEHGALAAHGLGDQRQLAVLRAPVNSAVGWNCTNSMSISDCAGVAARARCRRR